MRARKQKPEKKKNQKFQALDFSQRILFLHQNAGIPTHTCGGTIIDDSTILTAAHCFKDETLDFVHAGMVGFYHTEGSQHIGIKDVIIHPNFNNGAHEEEDYAIVKLRSPLIFSDKIQPACLPDNSQSKFFCFAVHILKFEILQIT